MPVRVCVAIRESTTAEAVAAAERAAEWADLVEIRADFIRDLDLEVLLRGRRTPMIFTLRSAAEGGEFSGSESARLETILAAARSGAEYVDVEFSAFWKSVLEKVPATRVILSHHNFEQTPANLEELAGVMAASGARILKIATRARCLADNLKVHRLLAYARNQGINLCALAMGREGIPSRILGPSWGSWMTFASLPGGEATADGQIAADDLQRVYRIRDVGAGTQLYGVIGKPLGHSLSPEIHNAAFIARKRDAIYLPMECSGFDDFLEFDASFGVQGLSVTIPYKEEAHARAGSLAVESDQTGAVNTLVRRPSGWHGENTDVDGFMRPFRRQFHVGRSRAVVLGAGGAARAVVCGLRAQGAAVCIVARNQERARVVADRFQAECCPWEQLGALQWDLLVNTTPIGMYPRVDETPVPTESLTGRWVYDLVYNPRETRLLREAAQRGLNTISGVEMFLGQAIKQQQLWCGSLAPETVMEEALEAALVKREHAAAESRNIGAASERNAPLVIPD